MPLSVRVATFADTDTILGFRRSLEEQGAKETGVPVDNGATAAALQVHETLGWFLDPEFLVLIAEDDGLPVGYTCLQERLYVGRNKGFSFPGLWVDPSYRNVSGAFLKLAQAVRRLVRKYGIRYIQTCVNFKNKPMLKFYSKLGFTPLAAVLGMEVRYDDGQPDHRPKNGQEVHGESRLHAGASP